MQFTNTCNTIPSFATTISTKAPTFVLRPRTEKRNKKRISRLTIALVLSAFLWGIGIGIAGTMIVIMQTLH